MYSFSEVWKAQRSGTTKGWRTEAMIRRSAMVCATWLRRFTSTLRITFDVSFQWPEKKMSK
jgi:hypothetical protein